MLHPERVIPPGAWHVTRLMVGRLTQLATGLTTSEMIFWSHGRRGGRGLLLAKAQRDVAPLEAAPDTVISHIASLTA